MASYRLLHAAAGQSARIPRRVQSRAVASPSWRKSSSNFGNCFGSVVALPKIWTTNNTHRGMSQRRPGMLWSSFIPKNITNDDGRSMLYPCRYQKPVKRGRGCFRLGYVDDDRDDNDVGCPGRRRSSCLSIPHVHAYRTFATIPGEGDGLDVTHVDSNPDSSVSTERSSNGNSDGDSDIDIDIDSNHDHNGDRFFHRSDASPNKSNIDSSSSSSMLTSSSSRMHRHNHNIRRSIHDNTDQLPYITDPVELESYVLDIEAINTLTSQDVRDIIHPLMIATSKLDTVRGAQLTERLLAKCIEIVSTFQNQPTSDEEGHRDEDYSTLPYPNAEMYNLAMTAWTKHAAQRVPTTVPNVDGENGGKNNGRRRPPCYYYCGADRAQQILDLMKEEYDREWDNVNSSNNDNSSSLPSSASSSSNQKRNIQRIRQVRAPQPDVINYTSVIQAWAKSDSKIGPQKALSLLYEMERSSGVKQLLDDDNDDRDRDNHGGIGDDHVTIGDDENTRNSQTHRDTADVKNDGAERPPRQRERQRFAPSHYDDDNRDRRRSIPDRLCYNTVLSAWSRSIPRTTTRNNNNNDTQQESNVISTIRMLLKRMEKLDVLTGGRGLYGPNTKSYNMLINAYAKEEEYGNGNERKRRRGRRMNNNNNNKSNSRGVKKTNATTRAEAAEEATTATTAPLSIPPSSSALKAEEVLRFMYDSYIGSFESTDGTRRFDGIDNDKDDDSDNDDGNDLRPAPLRPNVKSYNGVIHAWSNSDAIAGPYRAESILMSMLGFGVAEKIKKDENAGGAAVTRRRRRRWGSDSPIADDGVQPDIVTFNSVINAWAKSGLPESGRRGQVLLRLMGVRIDSVQDDDDGDDDGDDGIGDVYQVEYVVEDFGKWVMVRPNTVTYNSVMNAWSRSGVPSAGERVEAILNYMLDLPPGDEGRPNGISFSTAIYAWARNGAPERAESLLRKMEELYRDTRDEALRPSEACYGGVIFAWANVSGSYKNQNTSVIPAERAEDIMIRMRDVAGLRPTITNYNSVLEAWSKHRNWSREADSNNSWNHNDGSSPNKVLRARSLLSEILANNDTRGTYDRSVVSAGSQNVSIRKHPLLQPTTSARVSSSKGTYDFRPNTTSYNHLIAACASNVSGGPSGRRKAFFIAMDTYHRLCRSDYLQPDERTYIMMFRMVLYLLPRHSKESVAVSKALFQECSKHGLLSNAVWKLIQNALPVQCLREQLDCALDSEDAIPKDIRLLPSEWSCNVISRRDGGRFSTGQHRRNGRNST